MRWYDSPNGVTVGREPAHSAGDGCGLTILNMKFIFNILAALLLSSSLLAQQIDSVFPRLRDERFWVSGQANFVFQAQPGLDARYSGNNSFSSRYEKATSRVLTLFTGMQLSRSFEVLADVEEAGGNGLSKGLGLAAPPNADFIGEDTFGQRPYISRLMLHAVIGLSHETVEAQRGPLSTFGVLPAKRIEFRAGKFGVVDFFDTNAAGSDTHLGFLNSATMQNAAYDYPADASGYSWGAMAEYTSPRYSIRFAEALMPSTPGGERLVWNLRRAHSENVEVQVPISPIRRKPAVVRALAFVNHGAMGNYRAALTEGKTFLDTSAATKYGFGFNVEQALARGVTAFARVGWNDGRSGSFCYAEVDNTASAGLLMSGELWRRRFDRAGIGIASNGISAVHREYLAEGGSGMMLGDGALRYGRENGIEGFYTLRVQRGIYVSPSVQWIANPGTNHDRGAALIASFRTHVEF